MALVDFLSSLPLWLLAVVLNLWLMGVAVLGVWFVRRRLLPGMKVGYADANYAVAIATSSMLLYGLIAALTAVGVWQRHSEVSGIVSAEAAAIAGLWRDLGGYPQPQRDEMREILRGYTQQIINEAWPQQRRGKIPGEGVAWMDRFQDKLLSFEPNTDGQEIVHAETFRAFNHLVQQRRQRLDSVPAGLPGVLWLVLLPGAIGVIILFLFFYTEDANLQRFLLIGLAGFLAMVLFVIIALDRPFSGPLGITADSYQLIFDHHMKP
jgi:Protein of unknown function (DUF4239)